MARMRSRLKLMSISSATACKTTLMGSYTLVTANRYTKNTRKSTCPVTSSIVPTTMTDAIPRRRKPWAEHTATPIANSASIFSLSKRSIRQSSSPWNTPTLLSERISRWHSRYSCRPSANERDAAFFFAVCDFWMRAVRSNAASATGMGQRADAASLQSNANIIAANTSVEAPMPKICGIVCENRRS